LEAIGVGAGLVVASVTLARDNLWGAPLAAVSLFFVILLITLYTLWRTGESANNKSSNGLSPLRSFARSPNYLHLPGGFVHSLVRHMPPSFPWWILNRFLFWAAAIAIRTFLLNYMEDVLSLSLAEAQALSSRLIVVLLLGVLLLTLPAGIVADRIGRRPLLIVAGFMGTAGAVLFLFLRDINLLFVAGGLIAVAAGIFASASWALATDLVPGAEGAQYLALANAATVLGSISGRLGGPLIDGVNHLTNTLSIGYLVVFAIAALFFAGSSGVVLKIAEKLPASHHLR
jgi:MFS family permease